MNTSSEDMRNKGNQILQMIPYNDIPAGNPKLCHNINIQHKKATKFPMTKSILYERIDKNGFYEFTVPGDGNCQFSSVSDQLFGRINYHKDLRKIAVQWMRENGEIKMKNGTKLSDFIDTDVYKDWNEYCNMMEKDTHWGDQITLIALSNLFSRSIIIISSIRCDKDDNSYIVCIHPKGRNYRNREPLFLSHQHEYHYGSLKWKN